MGKVVSHIIILLGFTAMALADHIDKHPLDAILRVSGIGLLVIGICGCLFTYMATHIQNENNRENTLN